MDKVFIIAWKEFVATVATKGFIFGMLFPPFLITIVILVLPLLINREPPKVFGHVAVIDQSGVVAPKLEEAFSAERVKERRAQRLATAVDQSTRAMGLDEKERKLAQQQVDQMSRASAAGPGEMLMPETNLELRVLASDTPVEEAREEILKATGREQRGEGDARLALIVIPKATVSGTGETTPAGRPQFASYEILTAPRLDVEVQGDIRSETSRAIVNARLENAGQDVEKIRGLMDAPQAQIKAVTPEGDRATNRVAQMLIPGAFLFLLWIAVFTSGQYLLTSTIEEKSSRVMEVLLSAVSPMQLMVGKIMGKGAVGFLILLLYGGTGIAALVFFAMTHMLVWQNLLYLAIYFLIAYTLIACLFASIGAAVNDINEAQSLMGPVMIILVIPMMLWMPILRNPNSMFAQVCSFVPLINPFIMVLRIAGSEPVPFWQIPASIAVGVLTVLFMCWAAAKIFRIGVLMYGKPPNFATLIRWVRMA